MEMQSHYAGKIEILELSGRFDAHTAPAVAQWLEKRAAAAPAQSVISLVGVNFIDSTALAALVRGMQRCHQGAGDLHLCGMQQPVRIIFELTRLDKVFAIFSDEHAAVSAFAH